MLVDEHAPWRGALSVATGAQSADEHTRDQFSFVCDVAVRRRKSGLYVSSGELAAGAGLGAAYSLSAVISGQATVAVYSSSKDPVQLFDVSRKALKRVEQTMIQVHAATPRRRVLATC